MFLAEGFAEVLGAIDQRQTILSARLLRDRQVFQQQALVRQSFSNDSYEMTIKSLPRLSVAVLNEPRASCVSTLPQSHTEARTICQQSHGICGQVVCVCSQLHSLALYLQRE